MPRILRIHNRLIIGGPTHNVLNLTKYLQPEFETLLVTGEKESHEKDAFLLAHEKGIRPLVIPEMGRAIHPLNDFYAFQKLKKIIKEYRPDIVHTHAAKPGVLGRLAASALQVPVVVHTYHGHVFHSYFGKFKTNVFINIERAMAKRSDKLIAISHEQKRELTDKYKIAGNSKFQIIPLGFELDLFKENVEEKRTRFRSEFRILDDEIAIGIIGRLVPVKNHGLFLESIYKVLKNTKKRVKVFIIGDGETRSEIEQLAYKLEISFNVVGANVDDTKTLTFTSWRTDIDVINAGLDIICLSSLNEGTPVSLIEAQAAGKPIVATKVGGVEDIVIEGETALLSEIDDKERFFSNLLLLVEDEPLRKKMSEKGNAFVMERFGVQRLANDFRKLYYELLEQKGNGKNRL